VSNNYKKYSARTTKDTRRLNNNPSLSNMKKGKQTSVIVNIEAYRILSTLENIFAKIIEKRFRNFIESQLNDVQIDF
jgi:hypothetical protein